MSPCIISNLPIVKAVAFVRLSFPFFSRLDSSCPVSWVGSVTRLDFWLVVWDGLFAMFCFRTSEDFLRRSGILFRAHFFQICVFGLESKYIHGTRIKYMKGNRIQSINLCN